MSSVEIAKEDPGTEQETIQLDLRQLFRMILSKLWLIVICAVMGAFVSFLFAKFLVTPKYQSSVPLYVSNTQAHADTSMDANNQDLTTSRSLVETYIVILENVVVENTLSDYMLEHYDPALLAQGF